MVKAETFGYASRLALAIDEAQVTVRDVSVALGVTTQALYKVLRGDTKALIVGHHLAAARFLRVDPTWLSDGVGSRHPKGPVALQDNPEYPSLTVTTIEFEAGVVGHRVVPIDKETRMVVLPASWYAGQDLDPSKLFAVAHSGPAMEPTLHDGDIVVIAASNKELVQGEVVMVRLEDEAVLCRVFREGGSWWARFDNQDIRLFPMRVLPADVEVVGRAVHRQSDRL